MKDVLQTYKFNFEFNTKNAKKQLQSISDDVLKMLSDMDSASNKMKVFTNLVGYLEKLDGALSQFKASHKDDFDNMFGGLDAQLSKSLEAALGLDVSKLGQLSGLRERIDSAFTNKAGVKELRSIAQDINSLFASIGDREPINIDEWFTGKGKTLEQRIGHLNDQLHDFYMSYQLIANSVKGGFGAGGASGFAALSDEARQEAEQIKASIKELHSAGKQLESAKGTISKIEKKSSKTPADYKVDLTVESIQSLILEFDKLNDEIASGDSTSKTYYDNLVKMSGIVIKLKGALKDINANNDIKNLFVEAKSGKGDTMFGKLSEYANTKSLHFVQQYLDDSVPQTIQSIIDQYVQNFAKLIPGVIGDGLKIGDGFASGKTSSAASQYQQLIAKLNEYRAIIEDINFDPDDDVMSDKLFDIKNEIREIFNVSKDAKDVFNNLFDSYDDDIIDFSEFKNGLMGLLNVVEPVEGGLSEAQTALKEFLNLADTLKDVEYMSESAVDKNISKLEEMKSKLINLSEQGDITTADLQKINDAFDSVEVHLTSMKYGYGHDDSFQDEISEFGDEAQESADEVSAGLETVESKTHGVTSAFQELINYISKSGSTPKTFFESLASGAMLLDAELSSILGSLKLIDAEGNVKLSAVGSGSINSGGMISDQYALISRNKSKYLKYAVASQPKLFEAEKLGANVGTILDIFTDEANDVMYELQKRVSGVGLNDQNHNLNSLDFLEATDEQIKKLIKDLEILRQVGLYVDHNGKNILYDKKDGFSFIDLASKSTWFTAGEDNSVEENLDLFLTSLFGYSADKQSQDFMRRVYSLGGDVLGKNIMPDYLQQEQPDFIINGTSTANIEKEEAAHEQNTAAINAENQALKEQIELKKKAQSMTWESFALDESLSAAKNAAGIVSLADQEKFWKKSNYEKDIDFHSLSEDDADKIISRYFTVDERDQWYTSQNFSSKSPIENTILANDELRNAALNKLYYIYKKEGDPDERYKDVDDKSGFEDFLNREFTVYRGDSSPVLYGDEQKLSFSFDEFEARRFAAMDPKYVSSTTLIPKNTVGSLATEDYWGEQEVFVPSDQLPYIDYTNKSFSEYYSKLGPKMQQAIDNRFIQLEMDRVKSLLGDDVARGIEEVVPYNPELLNKFKQGLYPDKIDLTGELYNDSLAGAYNDLPEIKKKLAAYYASLYSIDPSQQFKSKTIGATGLLSAVMQDPSGVQQHIGNLTGESKFNIFGQSADLANAEADAHKNNAQAIQQEEQAQQELNNVKAGYKDVSDRLYDTMNNETWHQGKFVAMADISKNLSSLYDTDESILAQGKYASSATGEVFDISSLIDSINQFEQDWHMNLDYVKDYIQQVADGLKANKIDEQLQKPIKEIDVELDDDYEGDFDFDQSDLGGTKYVVQDYEYAYKNQNQAAQTAINDLAEFYQEYDALQSKIRGEPIEFLISSENPTLEEAQKVRDTFEALQNKIKEINDMSLVETEDDQKKLQELQAEAIGLQNTLRSAMTVDNSSFSYQSTYGLSLMDAIKMKSYVDGEDVYSMAKDLEDQLYAKQDDVYNNVTPDLQFMLMDDASDSLGQFLLQKAKQLQLEKEITAEQQKQENIADQTDSAKAVAEAQQQLAIEHEITEEQKKQTAMAVAAPTPPDDPNKIVAGGYTTLPDDPSSEIAELQNLLNTVDKVKQAVDEKTAAFKDEGVVVEQTVAQEVAALEKLSGAMNEVKSAVDAKTQAFKDEGAAVDKVAKKEKKALKKNQEQTETQQPQDDNTKNDQDNASGIKQEVQAHKDNADAIREEESAQEDANTTKRAAVDILKGYLKNRYPTLPDDALDKQAGMQINRLLNQTFVDDPSKGYIGKMIIHGSKDDSNILDPSYYLPEYKALDEVLQLIGYHLDELQPAMMDENTQWGFSAEIVANSEKVVTNMEQARKILLGMGEVNDSAVDQSKGNSNGKKSKSKITPEQKADKAIYETALKQYRGMLNKEMKNLKDFTSLDQGLNEQQQEIADLYNNTIRLIEQYSAAVKKGESVELNSIQSAIAALKEKARVYKEQNNLTDTGNEKKKSKTSYGQSTMVTISGKYNSLQNKINGNDMLSNSNALQSKLTEYEESLQRVTNLYNHLKTIDPTEDDKTSFKQASAECNNLHKDVENLILAYEKLHNDPNKIGEETLGDGFVNEMANRKQALLDYVESTHGSRAKIEGFVDACHGLEYTIDNFDGTFTKAKAAVDNLGTAIVEAAGDTQKATSKFSKFVGEVSSKFRDLWVYTASRFGVDEMIQQVRKGIQYVREIDGALTELKKVTSETDETYSKFLQSMSKTASVVGSTVKDLTNSAADWARLGYSLEEAGQLAETTAKLLNVSEFSSVDDATSALVSSLQAFTEEGQDVGQRAEEIVDILNNIGNKYPVATNELADGLATSSAALVAANNSIEEQVAMLAAGNATMQDVSTVASGLKIVAARLRGTTIEMDEDAESAVTNVSKLQAKIKALTKDANGGDGIDIINADGSYKSTYEILAEISKIFDKMDDISQANLLELIAGKNRSSVVAAILQNGDILEDAYADAFNSSGSAQKELDTYLESVQGHIDQFNNSVQTMWMNFLNTDAVKWFIHLGDAIIKMVDNVGLLKTALTTVGAFWLNKNFGDKLFGNIKSTTDNLKELKSAAEQAKSAWMNNPTQENKDAYDKVAKNLQAYEVELNTDNASQEAEQLSFDLDNVEASVQNIDGASDEVFEQLSFDLDDAGTHAGELNADLGETKKKMDDIDSASVAVGNNVPASFNKSTKSVQKFKKQMGQMLKSMALMYAISTAIEVVSANIEWMSDRIKDNSNSWENLNEKYQDVSGELENCESELRNLEAELDITNEQIDDLLSQGTLSFVEQEELERLQAVSAELERQLDITQTLQGSLQAGTSSAAIGAGQAYLGTSFESEQSKSERQEEAAEHGEKIGKAAGLAIGAGATAIGAKIGGGIGSVGGPIGIAIGAGVGSVIGGLIGSFAGSAFEGAEYDSEQTVWQAIDSMKKERAKLVNARDDAYAVYAETGTYEDKDAWQNAASALSAYDQSMAEHMSQLAQYYNTIKESWDMLSESEKAQAKEWGDMLDRYNITMGGKDAKANAINRIFGQEADNKIQSVKKSLEEMAKAGDKIDLKKAFGGDTAAYDAFVDRLYDMGIYIYECENAFEQMHQAEVEAAQVSFSDVAKDIIAITDALQGVKNAFEEFLEKGHSTPDTMLGLKEYFDAAGLQDLYEEYVGVMLSGNASIEEAQAITEKLAQAFVESRITADDYTSDQMLILITQLEELGITNADDFVTDSLQRSAIKAMEDVIMSKASASSDAQLMRDEDVKKVIDKYNLGDTVARSLVQDLIKKKTTKAKADAAQDVLNDYNAFLYGTDVEKGYLAAKEDYDAALKQYNDAKKKFDELAFDPKGWTEYSGYHYKDGEEALSDSDFKKKQQEYDQLKSKYDAAAKAEEEAWDQLSLIMANGGEYLDDDNELKEGVGEKLQADIDAAQDEVDKIDKEIEAKFTIDYSLEFGAAPVINTISGLTDALEQYKNVLSIVNEVVVDGQQISEDHYAALNEQLRDVAVGTEDFFDAIDTSNGYIVKNAALLKKLVAQSKRAHKATLDVAKSQAQLEYKNVVVQIHDAVAAMKNEYNAYGFVTDATFDHISAMREQLQTLKQTIQQYALLEIGLTDAANAYDEYEQAKERDAQIAYDDSFLEMLKTIDEGILNNETGTEAFEYAVKALVPEEFWKDIDDVDEKIRSIHDYLDGNEVFSKFFHVDEESGDLDINADNVREFVNMGRDKGIFDGDSTDFSLSDNIEGIEDVAKAFGVTEAAVLAMFAALEKVDAKWGNILTDVMTTPLEREVNAQIDTLDIATQAVENYWKAVSSGEEEFSSEKYKQLQEDVAKATEEVQKAEQAANDNARSYHLAHAALTSYRGDLSLTATDAKSLATALGLVDENGNPTISVNDDGSLQLTEDDLVNLYKMLGDLEEPTIMRVQLRYDDIDSQINDLQEYIDSGAGGTITIGDVTIDSKGAAIELLSQLKTEQKEIQVTYNITETSAEQDKTVLESYQELAKNGLHFTVTADTTQASNELTNVDETNIDDKSFTVYADCVTAQQALDAVVDTLAKIGDKEITVTVNTVHTEDAPSGSDEDGEGGWSHALGNAMATGSVGLNSAEHNAVVGELGPEMVVDPIKGVYYTVGDNGTEMVNLPKGAIIYNHKQTEELLKNGHTTRGKYTGGLSFARGNAHGSYGIPSYHPNTEDSTSFNNGSSVNQNWDDAASTMGDAADKVSDAADEFKEVFDWIEVRLEEINDNISLKSAQLENKVGYSKQNKTVDKIIDLNQKLYDNLIAGSNKYYAYSNKLLSKVPAEYRAAAQDGTIAIETFVGEADEKTLEAIQEYREWVQKGDEAAQQAEETLTEISSLAKQAIDNVAQDYENKRSLRDNKMDQYEAYNEFLETDQGFESASIYQAMIKENNKIISGLEQQRNKMQAELNKRVESGEIKKYSQDWYDAVNDIAAVDTEIIELKTDTENYQDTINELHWDKFDALMGRIEVVSKETENMIDILGNNDLVDESGNWTDEGITSLGLYAQQMEAAEVQAKKYEEEIKYLNKNWQKLGYTEEEYLEKLDELKDGQYDAIKAYHDSKDAIVDLNKERVDAIKDGIEKEIEAYEELIEKKKEELDAEKDLYDFQKSVMEQEKDIADLERQLAALSADNSASARAKRAQLEAELAEANQELQDKYYERSISNQQDALDKELENFKDEKDAEIEGWDEYLENTNQVVSDSLALVQANTETVFQTLQNMAQEYGLNIQNSITSAIIDPWAEGSTAIQSFSETFGISMSATVEELEQLAINFKETMLEIEQAGVDATDAVKENAQRYTAAEYQEPKKEDNKDDDKKQQEKSIKVGGKINAKGAKIYDYAGDKSGEKQYYSSDPIYTVLEEKNGYLRVRHHKSSKGTTGWFKKSDVKAYAKGSKGIDKDQLALIDELGEELQLVPDGKGRLAYIQKGTGILTHTMTERLMDLAMDPQIMLDQNRPQVGVHPEIHNTQIQIDNSVGNLIHIEHCDQSTLPDVEKIVNKALDRQMQNLNNSLKRFTR